MVLPWAMWRAEPAQPQAGKDDGNVVDAELLDIYGRNLVYAINIGGIGPIVLRFVIDVG